MKQANLKRKEYGLITCKMLLLVIVFAFTLGVQAQVTIGTGEEPVAGALLQLKDKANVTDGTFNAHKGLALPRVTLSEKKELYPMFLTDPNDPSSGPNAAYNGAANKLALDKAHTGLIVYNLVEDDDKELCLGLNQWDGEQWNCFQSKMGNAKFDPVSCSDIAVGGVYIEGKATTSANYLSINLNVTKVGAFAITATTGNGYSFYLSGVALSLGLMTVNVPCQGTPVTVQTDKLVFSGMELVTGCEPEVEVSSAVASYSLNCSSIVVNGQYLKGTALTASNTITLNVTVTTAGSYSINTPLTYGIRFSASGNFTVGTQTVTLIGSGMPTVNSDFSITINTNTQQGNDICTATIPMTLPAMTYAIIGNGDYSWSNIRSTAIQAGNSGANASFGPNGIVKIEKLTRLWETSNIGSATTYLTNGFTGTLSGTVYTNAQPDVVLYFSYGAAPSAALITQLTSYVKKGGVLIYGTVDNQVGQANDIIQGIFEITNGNASNAGASSNQNIYQINNLPNDPIINGPFGNLINQFWGEDNAGTIIVTELPPNSVQICSARNKYANSGLDSWNSVVWYNDSRNFVYFGDSTAASTSSTSTTGWPALYTSGTGLPRYKKFGRWDSSTAGTEYVFNAALELNSLAWGLKKAAVSGINPH
ncbi:MAG: hypothetical protein LBT43_09595 [Prevotella sp.]|jgi:hypothetical protein|nr:hypothetical protein [Prevotella sp.]